MTASPLTGSILCPVDFSEVSVAALRLAVRLGERCQQPVTALYVEWFEVPPYVTAGQSGEIEAQRRNSLSDAKASLDRFVGETIGGTGVALRVEEGDPLGSILAVAKETGSGLIVMGTHGRTGLRRLTLGSVAEEVLHSSDLPLVTLRHDTSHAIGRILCAVNDSEAARKALRYAAGLATCLDAQLSVLHVVERGSARRIPDLCAWIGTERPTACEIQEITRHGDATTEILQLAAEQAADLLVIGSEHRVFRDQAAIGSTTAALLRQAPCATLTIH